MKRIELYDKVYYGEEIVTVRKNNIEISIYSLSITYDKFLVLQKKGTTVKDFIITGSDKIQQMIKLLDKTSLEEVENEINSSVKKLEEQCYIKKLRKVDLQKYKNIITSFYDENYCKFIILGIKLPELIEEINQKAAV
ncbi:MAG TPA: hypothetical protein PKY26_05205 [Acetivibrio clariflavus]|nr:hypothetical protein [Acetivibrio clariflavus]